MTARRMVVQARPPRTSPVPTQQIRRDAAFVEEHIVTGIMERLPVAPLPTLRGHISASLFVGVYRFF